MMMGLGFLIMLAILAVPILLVIGLVILLVRPVIAQTSPSGALARAPSAVPMAAPQADVSATTTCSHCGAQLQPEWVHCPQCGAPV
jgi:hypothetical protein